MTAALAKKEEPPLPPMTPEVRLARRRLLSEAEAEVDRVLPSIKRRRQDCYELGRALGPIHEQRLYLDVGYKSWEAFCGRRLGLSAETVSGYVAIAQQFTLAEVLRQELSLAQAREVTRAPAAARAALKEAVLSGGQRLLGLRRARAAAAQAEEKRLGPKLVEAAALLGLGGARRPVPVPAPGGRRRGGGKGAAAGALPGLRQMRGQALVVLAAAEAGPPPGEAEAQRLLREAQEVVELIQRLMRRLGGEVGERRSAPREEGEGGVELAGEGAAQVLGVGEKKSDPVVLGGEVADSGEDLVEEAVPAEPVLADSGFMDSAPMDSAPMDSAPTDPAPAPGELGRALREALSVPAQERLSEQLYQVLLGSREAFAPAEIAEQLPPEWHPALARWQAQLAGEPSQRWEAAWGVFREAELAGFRERLHLLRVADLPEAQREAVARACAEVPLLASEAGAAEDPAALLRERLREIEHVAGQVLEDLARGQGAECRLQREAAGEVYQGERAMWRVLGALGIERPPIERDIVTI